MPCIVKSSILEVLIAGNEVSVIIDLGQIVSREELTHRAHTIHGYSKLKKVHHVPRVVMSLCYYYSHS